MKNNNTEYNDNTKKIVYDTETAGINFDTVTSKVHVDNTQMTLNSCEWVNTKSNLVRREFQESGDYAWFHLTTIEKIIFKFDNDIMQELDVSEDELSEDGRDYTVVVFNQSEKFIVVGCPDNIISNYDEYNGFKFKVPNNSQIIADKVNEKVLEVYIKII